MKHKYLIVVIFQVFLLSCSRAEYKIIRYIENNEKTTILDLQNALMIDYDSLYLFCEYSSSYIPQIIGIPYDNTREIKDGTSRMLFIKDGIIVYEDDYDNSHLYFETITEKLDTTEDCYLVHYGKKYTIHRGKSQDNSNYYVLEKISEGGVLYNRSYIGGGIYRYDTICN